MSSELIILSLVALVSGFIDSIAGGGGLIQTPATLVTLSRYDVVTVLGTLKIPSFAGTSSAAIQYARKVKVNIKLLVLMCFIALIASYIGSFTLSHVSNNFMKPVIFTVLIILAIYTYTKKTFGTITRQNISTQNEILYASLIALTLGFYDGFIGPGAGSILIILFISIFGFDFLHASTYAKCVNVSTNLGSIIFFSTNGHILYEYALPMAACNFIGSILGSRLAILKGNSFIRSFFLIIILLTILRFGYDIFCS